MADWGYGTTLGYREVGGSTYTTVAKIINIDDKKIKRKKIGITTLDSANHTEECQAGMVEPDAFKFRMIYNKTDHATLLGYANLAAPNKDWKITLSDGSNIAGTGYISEFPESPKAENEKVYENEISIQPVGKWTFTPAS